MHAPGLSPLPSTSRRDGEQAADWLQISMRCADWRAAEHAAITHVAPVLSEAEQRGHVTSWWFVRKGPTWRIRLRPGHGANLVVDTVTAALLASDDVETVTEQTYEPETFAFGGPGAMNIAHDLFAADSRHVLAHLARARGRCDHRRELGVLLALRLLRAAGLDWYEQGDVWYRLAAHRSPTDGSTPAPRTIQAVGRLLTAAADSPTSPLYETPDWPAAHENAGRALAELAHTGDLGRGLRAVAAHHLMFGFNRLGISATDQYVLAASAGHHVLQEDHHVNPLKPATGATTIEATRLREGLADHIRSRGTFRSAAVERAFRTVPRHLFLPGVDLADAYAPRPVVTKCATNGTALSSASSPNLVADMLELLAPAPGHRVLEIGAATGINAALLAELVGEDGHVVTVEIDQDLADGARTGLDTAGYRHVEVHCRDGARGYPAAAPYDRIIVTAGAWDIPAAWWDQLASAGRLVVPVRLHASGLTRVLSLDHIAEDRMVADSALVCGFVPMRGADAHPEDVVRLAEEVVLAVDMNDHPDAGALVRALAHPPRRQWTDIVVRHDEPAEHLDLWLTTNMAATVNFGRLSVSRTVRDTGIADPAPRWAGATLYAGGTLAYLRTRRRHDDVDELGIAAHGPDGNELADQLRELLEQWDEARPGQPAITAIRNPTGESLPGTDVARDHTRLTVAW